jgi:hypothetical protein
MIRRFFRTVAVSASVAATLTAQKKVLQTLLATANSVATLTRQLGFIFSTNSSVSATLALAKTFLRTLTTTSVVTLTIVKRISLTFLAAITATPQMIRGFFYTLAASASSLLSLIGQYISSGSFIPSSARTFNAVRELRSITVSERRSVGVPIETRIVTVSAADNESASP